MERLDKILANAGFGTRKEVKRLVRDGKVTVDGVSAASAEVKVDAARTEILVEGTPVGSEKFIYLMLNKPGGCICATRDSRHKTVADLVPEAYRRFRPFPVGRLDIDTEGLLLMTNDGALAHALLSPKKHVPKTYFARVSGEITQSDIDAFRGGIVLGDGYKTRPAVLERTDGGCFVTITEGKFHQIKRMFERTGKRVTYLKRVKMGGLELDPSLMPGDIKEITKEESDTLWTSYSSCQ
jgi:16S rRNA pseudouridine516 synthase